MATEVVRKREAFQKNARERVEIWAEPYHGHDLVHARVFCQDEHSEWHPTPKGLSLSPELAGQVARAMLELARSEGLEENP